VNRETWIDYARQLEQTGVDALECNLFASPRDPEKDSATVEEEQVGIVRDIKAAVSIPVSLKLSFFYTNPLDVVRRLADAGADAFVLFNRLFEPDLDIEEKKHTCPLNFSYETDYRLSLRYAGLLEGAVSSDVCCSTGIFTGETVVKMLLAGAACVQTVSAVYQHGYGHVATMLQETESWIEKIEHSSLDQFRGKLSRRHSVDPWAYTRAQYARLLMNPEEVVKNVPTM
jgi:dihydroorotate dehydrogenase (fumarate)